MNKTLLLFIQSQNIGVYVNVITHCVNHENVRDIIFIGNQVVAGRKFELTEFIAEIRTQVEDLADNYPQYKSSKLVIPNSTQVNDRIMRVIFSRPQDLIPQIKQRFSKFEEILIDVSGCNKRLASDVMTSFMAAGIYHICQFELADKVYSDEWRQSRKSKLYHDLHTDSVIYYEYDDFSAEGTTSESINKLRAQGRIIRLLLLLSVVLGISVIILINNQQNISAQLAALILALITGLGFLEDSFSLFERLRN